ncbi:hypothetical protein [Tepidibacter hydrothermalis]|uniref:Barstar (barnase inhibitor) domain-containing protein n=1 Tax=Tepidibacter hydrothermalis TaxID=3036126 RepID=A0ABY8EFV4_9FIRM|nr:hypothetical protein [Tepidibacter hydrothermalis]WFD10362.1 hypothetical protein P4S50_19035 [Tepidibacter hydrothermalis]
MEIVDSKGMYTILVDKRRRIVYEKNVGVWTSEDFKRFLDDYKNIVFTELGNDKPWAKFCNLSQYEVSSIYNELIEFLILSIDNGFSHCAIISNSSLVNSQIHEVCKQISLNHSFFGGIDAFQDAGDWLEDNGYTI